MDALPTLLGALPDLGIGTTVVVVVLVAWRILATERAYFTAERERYRAEAEADRAELREEIADRKRELREMELRLRDLILDAAGTARLPRLPPSSPPSGGWPTR